MLQGFAQGKFSMIILYVMWKAHTWLGDLEEARILK